jgi:hypothetical protein
MAPKCATSVHPEVKAAASAVSAAVKAAVSVANAVVNAAQQTPLAAMPKAPRPK